MTRGGKRAVGKQNAGTRRISTRHRQGSAAYFKIKTPAVRLACQTGANLIREAEHRTEVERLAKLLLAHMERTGDPQTENFRKALQDWQSGK